jgi:hypothetical protein
MGLQAAPANGAHDYHKFVNTTTQYVRHIAYLRELLNHTFLRAIYHTSTRQTKMEYKEVQEPLLDKNARRQANAVEQFTVKDIIHQRFQ